MPLSYHQQLEALQRAIIHKDFSEMLSLTKLARHNAISSTTRLNVYARGYHTRLDEATLSDYPALAHFIGKEKLKETIAQFTHCTPSNYWDLNLYPYRFFEYFKKTSDNNKAIALCQLEAAISEVYWQPHSSNLSAESLATLDEETFGNLRFTFRTASK